MLVLNTSSVCFATGCTTHTHTGIETLDDDEDSDWLGEYQRGCDWEIYTTELARYTTPAVCTCL